MHQRVSFHFHGYQPGDVIYRQNTDPFEPMKFVERNSPVELKVGEEIVKGNNWTDVNLRAYVHAVNVFRELAETLGAPAASVDIEPYTVTLLIEKDRKYGTKRYEGIMDAFEKGMIDLVVTIPFHPILPHLDPNEQMLLSRIMFEFFKSVIKKGKIKTGPDGKKRLILGVWLPEGVITEATGKIVQNAFDKFVASDEAFKDVEAHMYFLLDSRQFIAPWMPQAFWSMNFLDMGDKKPLVFGRDAYISDAFSFGTAGIGAILENIVRFRCDPAKEERGITYTLTLISDLETLLASPPQAKRFQSLMKALDFIGVRPSTHADFIAGKLTGTDKAWEGEVERSDAFKAIVKEYSSWSDYSDMLIGGKTSDTRWTGVRRADAKVIFRHYKRFSISQIWKLGFRETTNKVNTYVRRGVLEILKGQAKDASEEKLYDFLVEYSKIIFKEHFIMQGVPREELEFKAIVERTVGQFREWSVAARAARAYYMMLMGNRSCPRFWEIIDTRVAFQNVVFLTHALLDLLKIYQYTGQSQKAERTFKLYKDAFVNFHNAYEMFYFDELSGLVGWETSTDAWVASIQSRVPERSTYNVVRRASLYVGLNDIPELLPTIETTEGKIILKNIVADTAHILGEMHGDWKTKEYCEHREDAIVGRERRLEANRART